MGRKLDCCNKCHFYSHNPYLVCAEHTDGVDGNTCPDFVFDPQRADDEAVAFYEPWQPEGASYYDGELVLEPVQRLTLQQKIELLDEHPLFTGRCPNCEMPIRETDPPRVHCDCPECGWINDSI